MPESGMQQGRNRAEASRSAWLPSHARPELFRTSDENLVELHGVSKRFAGRAPGPSALSDVSLRLAARTAILVEGPSGSGKTTLLSLIGCMTRPTSGRILVAGRDVTRLGEDRLAELRRRTFGFVFQSHHLIRGLTALDNVMIPALPCPEVDGDLRPRAYALLDRFQLGGRARTPVELLSGGEQQRVAIARALVNDPPIVLADEPTAHLDAFSAHGVLDLVTDLLERGKTVIVASHDPVLCRSGIFSRVLHIEGGRLVRQPDGRLRPWS